MKVIIKPSDIAGTLSAPSSKSSMQRACASALLHNGISFITNAGKSNDDLAALNVIQQLGAEVHYYENGIKIISSGIKPVSDEINCGESGLGVRMFTPIAALSNQPVTITGTGTLLNRPMHFFNEIFPALGVSLLAENGKLPLHIKGPLKPADITVDGSISSQFITGLLMAYSVAITKPVTITAHNLTSKPYIDLTLDVMKAFGLNTPVNEDYKKFIFSPAAKDKARDIYYNVEGDWSSASFLLVAAAIAGNITLTGLNIHSVQADKAIVKVLELAGCKPVISENEIMVSKAPLKAFEFDCTDCPDLFPPLVALAAYCKGISALKGVHRLTHKESNRTIALQQEFNKMGVEIIVKDDFLYVHGGIQINGAAINPHNDHRIAMAGAIAGLKASTQTIIESANVVNKSYPVFFNDLEKITNNKVYTMH